MKKKIKSFILCIVIWILSISILPKNLFVFKAFAQNTQTNNFAIDYDAEMETDSVIVTLTLEETQKLKSYTTQDFNDVDCVAVDDLTQSTFEYAKAKRDNATTEEKPLINLDNYKRILKLTLNENSKDNVIDAVTTLNRRTDVYIATPNYIYTINSDTEEEIDYYDAGEMWGLNGTHGIQANKAWNICTGERSVVVGVLDSGIQGDHPALQWQLNHQGLHRNFLDGQETTEIRESLVDYFGHGTHVAGTIGALNNQDSSIRGVCWSIELVSLRVFNNLNGKGPMSNIIRAINYAGNANIPILNLSGGGYEFNTNLQPALEGYNGLFVCAAGNGDEDGIGVNNDEVPHYPSDYSYGYMCSDRVISVGSINEEGQRSSFSNYGQNSVNIYAPGEDILSAFPSDICESICHRNDSELSGDYLNLKAGHYADGYHSFSGTSMATPHVTGVAALLRSIKYDLTAAQLKTAIINSADTITIETPTGNYQSVKKLNAHKAVKYVLENYETNSTLTSTSQSFSYEVNSGYDSLAAQNFFLIINANTNFSSNFTVSSTSALNITLYDDNFSTVNLTENRYDNGCTIQFKKYLPTGTYYLKSSYADNNDSGTINVTFSGTVHNSHSYTDRYEPALLNHSAYCTCGEYQVKPHIVRVGISGPDSTCALCGAPVPTTIGGLNSIQATATYVTLNGSFIAQNGIIYLVDADWDAYFAGTLQFYLNTNLPIVTNRVAIYGEGLL